MTVSLSRQISCVERELKKRASVYARLVASGRMRQSVADLEIGDMQAVRATLQWLADNETTVRGAVAKTDGPTKGPCPHWPECGCGTQSGPHTCEWRNNAEATS